MNNNILDNIAEIKKLDKSNVLGSVQQLSAQLRQTDQDLKSVHIPSSYQNVNNIVLNGMGGSRLGGRVMQRLFEQQLSIPIIPIGGYSLPSFVDDRTLLILSSYSGTTEEILSTFNEAVKRKTKLLIFAERGKLMELAKLHKLLGYYGFQPKHNPCNQPRMSIGYQILGIMLLLVKAGLLHIKGADIEELINNTQKIKNKYDINVHFSNNLAKQEAVKMQKKIPLLIGAEFLMGALHVVRNQINENAKQLAFYFEIPELNHHLLEGIQFPQANPRNLHFIFCESSQYFPKNQRRIEITKKVLHRNHLQYSEIKLFGKTKLQQVFEVIQFGSFVSFYLSMLNNLDPTPIPWVDYFKKELLK